MSFILRELQDDDLSNGFFETLSNLSEIGGIGKERNLAKKILNRSAKNIIKFF